MTRVRGVSVVVSLHADKQRIEREGARRVAGVEFVRILRLYEVDLRTGERARQDSGRRVAPAEDELIASGEHIVRVDG